MFESRAIERELFKSPIADSTDLEKYPEVDEETFNSMLNSYLEDTSKIHVFCFSNDGYIEFYIFDWMLFPEMYHRFVIVQKHMMSEEEESLFNQYISDTSEFIVLTKNLDNFEASGIMVEA